VPHRVEHAASVVQEIAIAVASFHILRHTWASLAIMAGAPPVVGARNLGHADTCMLELHLAPIYIVDAIRAAAPKFGIKLERKVVSIEN
jgi:integrase